MILRFNDVTKVRFKDNKAEIIVKDKYKLTIILRKNKVVVKYPEDTVVIGISKFNTEGLASTIYELVKNSGEFDIEVIKNVVQNLEIGDVCGKFAKKLLNMTYEEGDKVIEEFEKFVKRV